MLNKDWCARTGTGAGLSALSWRTNERYLQTIWIKRCTRARFVLNDSAHAAREDREDVVIDIWYVPISCLSRMNNRNAARDGGQFIYVFVFVPYGHRNRRAPFGEDHPHFRGSICLFKTVLRTMRCDAVVCPSLCRQERITKNKQLKFKRFSIWSQNVNSFEFEFIYRQYSM